MFKLLLCVGFLAISCQTQGLFLNDDNMRNLEPSHASSSSSPARASRRQFTPRINSTAAWMTSLKQNLIFGSQTIKDVILPGCHHCGLTSLVYNDGPLNDLVTRYNVSADLLALFNSQSTPVKTAAVKALYVGQKYNTLQSLQMGVRYLDIRIGLGADNVTYLSHIYLSTTTLLSVLQQVNTFITANPKEIVIVRITNDNNPPRYTVGSTVPAAYIDALIAQVFTNTSVLLNSTNLKKKINTYGGIFFTGEMTNSVGTFATSTSFADNPEVEPLFNNITQYYNNNTFKKQAKTADYVQLGSYVRGGNPQMITTIVQFLTDLQTGTVRVDSIVSSKIEPMNIPNVAPYLNDLVLGYISQSYNALYNTNIITIDLNDPKTTQEIFRLNQLKFFLSDF